MTLEEEEFKLYGLTYGCPYQQRMDECLLKEIDHLPFKEKVSWINNLSFKTKQKIIEQHKNCSKNRV